MSKPDNGGSAFPLTISAEPGLEIDLGMTLRDWFAGMALNGIMSGKEMMHAAYDKAKEEGVHVHQFCAGVAYKTADAMIAEREKETE